MRLSLGFSPCPNDTFIFDALVNGKIDTKGLEFEYQMLDVEELNQRALQSQLDITKLSYHAYLHLQRTYILLNSGSALGNKCGPLLIARSKLTNDQLESRVIAIPGEFTTANLLFSIAYPAAINKKFMVFNEIEAAILEGSVDAGVIIHENRFTYQEKGLVKIQDLGCFWEKKYLAPIPLGGIAAKRSLAPDVLLLVDSLVRQSVEYAFSNPASSSSFVQKNAQEMAPEIVQNHIQLYVNDYSLDLGVTGRDAISVLQKKANEVGLVSNETELTLFVEKP